MAYFPASCDYDCKDCSQNKGGWCAFHDCPTVGSLAKAANQAVTINPYNYSATTIEKDEEYDMKAPDKIYANDYGIWYSKEPASKQTEQYIRKEALLEFMNKQLQESADRLDFHANQAYAEVLDRLKEM